MGAVVTLVLAYPSEHTPGALLERLGPHVAAALSFVTAQVAIVVGVAGVVPLERLYAVVLGSAVAVVGYRVAFGPVRPIPEPLLERERRAKEGEYTKTSAWLASPSVDPTADIPAGLSSIDPPSWPGAFETVRLCEDGAVDRFVGF